MLQGDAVFDVVVLEVVLEVTHRRKFCDEDHVGTRLVHADEAHEVRVLPEPEQHLRLRTQRRGSDRGGGDHGRGARAGDVELSLVDDLVGATADLLQHGDVAGLDQLGVPPLHRRWSKPCTRLARGRVRGCAGVPPGGHVGAGVHRRVRVIKSAGVSGRVDEQAHERVTSGGRHERLPTPPRLLPEIPGCCLAGQS